MSLQSGLALPVCAWQGRAIRWHRRPFTQRRALGRINSAPVRRPSRPQWRRSIGKPQGNKEKTRKKRDV